MRRIEYGSLPLLALIELATGLVVVSGVEVITSYPIVLFILPALMNLRGDVYGSLSIRTVTALHMGLSEPTFRSEYVASNLRAAVLITILSTTIIAFASIVVEAISWSQGLGAILLPLSYGTALLAFILVVPITLKILFETFKRGVSIEYLAAPLVSGIADAVTPAVLLPFVVIVQYPIASIFILLITIAVAAYARRLDAGSLKFVKETSSVTILAATLSGFGGLFYALNVKDPFVQKILLSAPGFNAVLGALAGIIASNLSIRLQTVGTIRVGDLRNLGLRLGLQYFAAILTLALPTLAHGGAICLYALLAASAIGLPIMLTSTYYMTTLTFRRGLDPDNVVFPVMTALGDLAGPALIISSYLMFKPLI